MATLDLNFPLSFWAYVYFFQECHHRRVGAAQRVLIHARMMIVAVMLTRWSMPSHAVGELMNTWHLQDAARPGTVHGTTAIERCIPVSGAGDLRVAKYYCVHVPILRTEYTVVATTLKIPSGSYSRRESRYDFSLIKTRRARIDVFHPEHANYTIPRGTRDTIHRVDLSLCRA